MLRTIMFLLMAISLVACKSRPNAAVLAATAPGMASPVNIVDGPNQGANILGTTGNPLFITIADGGASALGPAGGVLSGTYPNPGLLSDAGILSALTASGDLSGTYPGPKVAQITGTSPVVVQPSAGTTSLSVDTTGAVIGKTASSDIGVRIAPLVSQETVYAGIWTGAQALSPASNNYTLALAGSTSSLSFMAGTGGLQLTGPLTAQNIVVNGGTLGGVSGAPMGLATTAGAIACVAGGTQTVTAAQGATPGLNVTWTTLTSNCVVDFGTNAVTGIYFVSLSGTSLGAFTLGFKNGTTTRTVSASQFTALNGAGFTGITVWPHGTNNIDTL